MKKIFGVLFTFVLIFSSLLVFASCGGSNGDGGNGGGGNGGASFEDLELGTLVDKPNGYVLFENDVATFYQNSNWLPMDTSNAAGAVDMQTGTSVNAMYEPLADKEDLTNVEVFDSFISAYKNQMAAQGRTLEKEEEIGGYTVCTYTDGTGLRCTQAFTSIFDAEEKILYIAFATYTADKMPFEVEVFFNSLVFKAADNPHFD